MNNLGQNIRKERKKAGLDQAQLAEALGLSQTAICRFEKGSRNPSVLLLKKIASTLGCSFAALVNEESTEYINVRTGNHETIKEDPEKIFLETLLAQNPDMSVQLRSLANRREELTPEDWKFLADHILHALCQAEVLIDRMSRA